MSIESPTHIKVVAGVILLTPDHKYVLGKRVKPIDAGKYACVGGKVTEHPSDAALLGDFTAPHITNTAQSEVEQELGLRVFPQYFGRNDHYREQNDTYYCVFVFYALVANLAALKPNTTEVSEVICVSPETLNEIDIGLGHDELLSDFTQKTEILPKLVHTPQYPFIEPHREEPTLEASPAVVPMRSGRQVESSWKYQLNAIYS